MKRLFMEEIIQEALSKGVEMHVSGEFDFASQLYGSVIKLDPNHADANHNMGLLKVDTGHALEALPYLQIALQADTSVAQFWLSYIKALIQLDRVDEASRLLRLAKESGAQGEEFLELHQQLGEPSLEEKPVKSEADTSSQSKPNILDTLKLDKVLRLAKNKVKEGSPEEAKRIYQDILKKFPKNKQAQKGLVALNKPKQSPAAQSPPQETIDQLINLYNQGHFKQALVEASQSLRQFPGSVVLYNIIGAINAGLGELDAAVESYRQATIIKPDYADAYNNMGITLKDQGKLEEAIEAFNKVLSLKPDSAEAYSNMGNAIKAQGKLEEAIKAYKQALTIKPDSADIYSNIGNTLQERGKLDEAIKVYNKALLLNPDDAEVYYNMGNALKEQGKLEEAIKAYNKALSLKPDYSEAIHMISALSGETTDKAPREYVEKLFDQYASGFESSLIGKLEYGIPKILADIITKQSSNSSLGSILDLGCGTGLFGLEIKNLCDYLEGIDLSSSMINQAKQKNVYHKLTPSDIIEYLSSQKLNFDYFVSADVFVYVGNLEEVFRLIKLRNTQPGKLVFSTEHSEKDGFHLQETGRYSHSKSYIEGLCKEFNYTLLHFSTSNLRKEKGEFIEGGLYILNF
jgi:predicted TPR repeat methyltransferase